MNAQTHRAACPAASSGTTSSKRLLTFPKVLITGRQAFLTEEALSAIAQATLGSLADAEAGRAAVRGMTAEGVRAVG